MPIYGIDVKICATAYIRATSEQHAVKIAKTLQHRTLDVRDAGHSEIEISACNFSDPALPDISLSPAMTISGPDDDDEPEFVED